MIIFQKVLNISANIMKIHRSPSKNGKENEKSHFLNMYMNVYFLIGLLALTTLIALVYLALAGGLVSLGETFASEEMSRLNYEFTETAVKQLMQNKRYRDAMYLMEYYQQGQFEHSVNFNRYLVECYIRIGEHKKALEKIDIVERQNSQFTYEMELYRHQIYSSLNDSIGQEHTFQKLLNFTKDLQYNPVWRQIKLEHLKKINPQAAIDSLKQLRYPVEDSGKLVEWYLASGDTANAKAYCNVAVSYAFQIREIRELETVGPIAEQCYQFGDSVNGYWLQRMYMRFLDKYYDKDDLTYQRGKMKLLKYSNKKTGDIVDDVTDCCYRLRKAIRKNLPLMSEVQRELFISDLKEPFIFAKELLHQDPQNKDLAKTCFENAMFLKGLMLRSSVRQRYAVQQSGNKQLISDFNILQRLKVEYAGREQMNRLGDWLRLRAVKDSIQLLDDKISKLCVDYKGQDDILDQDDNDILNQMKEKTVIHFDENGDLLIALVCQNNEVKYIELCQRNEVVKLLQELKPENLYNRSEFYKLIWGNKLQKFCEDGSDVYYSCNGVFNQIAIPAIEVESHVHLFKKYKLHFLSNPAYASTLKDEVLTNPRIALWGGIDYGLGHSYAAVGDSHGIIRHDKLQYLPASLKEVQKISKKFGVEPYTGKTADELSFRSRQGKKDDILHISTHGFFKEDVAHQIGYDPLFSTGLFFAGANRAWQQEDSFFINSENDGILRGSEIAMLNLTSCNLVVLSACDTGLGQEEVDEGVYGLQRAFKLAGVDKIIMSLWPVSEDATSYLMVCFYDHLKNGEQIEDAFRKAQQETRRYDRFSSPRFWGAFVLLN